MTKEFSEDLCARIGAIVARENPRLRYTDGDVEDARRALSDRELAALRRAGYLGDDFELYYAIENLLPALDLPPEADDAYAERYSS